MNSKKLGEMINDKRLADNDLRTFVDPSKTLGQPKKVKKVDAISAQNYYQSLSPAEKLQFKKDFEKQLARKEYLSYLQYVFGSRFKPTKFHKFLASVCEKAVKDIEAGKEVKICLSVPPRHGKSMCVTQTLPSWFVGRNPNDRCIITAYNADLAENFGDKNREKVRKFGKELFNIEISKSQDNKTLFEIKNKTGGIYSVGLAGGITGNGARLFVIDDPYKNRQDAKTNKQVIMDSFKDSVMTRLEGKGRGIIVIHTRWLEDDLIGELSKDPQWIVINIPCIAGEKDPLGRKQGEALCPELGFDEEWAKQRKADVGDSVWSALYQGKPTIENGEVFKKDDIHFYRKEDLPPLFDEVTQSWDCAFNSDSTSDYVAGGVWGRKGANHYLLKRIKQRLNFKQTCDMIKFMTSEFPQTGKILIEKKANGAAVIQTLKEEVEGIIEITPKESKYGRAVGVEPMLASGNVFLPDPSVDPTVMQMVDEMLHFPNGKHDDEIDQMTQYLNEQRNRTANRLLYTEDIIKIGDAIRGVGGF